MATGTRRLTVPRHACSALSQGKYEKALEVQEEALRLRRKTLAPDHPHIASSLENVGNIYQNLVPCICPPCVGGVSDDSLHRLCAQGQLEAALPLLEEALRINRKALGAEHPTVSNSVNSLAVLYQKQVPVEAPCPG